MSVISSPLIVDFPSKPRHRRARPSVSFANMIDLTLYDCPASERRSKSYTSQDCKRFQVEAIRDAQRLGMMLAYMKFDEDLPEDQYESAVGVEKILSRGIAMCSKNHKLTHSSIIVGMQHACTAENLGVLSCLSSKPAQRIAQTSACLATAATSQESQDVLKKIVFMRAALHIRSKEKALPGDTCENHCLMESSSSRECHKKRRRSIISR